MSLADALYILVLLAMMLSAGSKHPKTVATLWAINALMLFAAGKMFLGFACLIITVNEVCSRKDENERVPLTD